MFSACGVVYGLGAACMDAAAAIVVVVIAGVPADIGLGFNKRLQLQKLSSLHRRWDEGQKP